MGFISYCMNLSLYIMSSCLRRYSAFNNTLGACWIAVDEWSNSMQNCFDLLVMDVMPIYMIMPRYSHNYALFYQLLDSNLFTHRNTYALERSH